MSDAAPPKKKERCLNVIIVGDPSVGKTAMIRSFISKTFNEEHVATLGIDFMQYKYITPNEEKKEVEIKIWDTAGQERFRTLTTNLYKKADAIIIAFDVTQKDTFDDVNDWNESINENANPLVPKILVGNKCEETERKVTAEAAQKQANNLGWGYYDVSAKTTHNLDVLFPTIFEKG